MLNVQYKEKKKEVTVKVLLKDHYIELIFSLKLQFSVLFLFKILPLTYSKVPNPVSVMSYAELSVFGPHLRKSWKK